MIKGNKGFSLVELMVVVAIIGILAAIAVPNFQKFTAKSKQSEVKSNLSALYSSERAFQAEWQTYDSFFQVVGYAPVGTLRYQHGFGADYHNPPSGFTGTATGQSSTITYCSQGGNSATPTNGCTVSILPVAPGGFENTPAAANTTFVAEGRGDIDGDAAIDVWTINELKVLINKKDDLTL